MFENMNADQMGLLQTGLAILSNAYGPNARNAIGLGGMQGLQAMQQAKMAEQDDAYRKMQMKALEAKTRQSERELQVQDQIAGLFGLGAPQQPALLAQGMAASDAGPTLLGGSPASVNQGSPRAPGLAGLDLNQVAIIKAMGGPDLMDAWKLSREGIERKAGSTYEDLITGETKYNPRMGEGVTIQNGQVQALPGYAESQADIQGAQAAAQQEAAAARDLIKVPDGQGGTIYATRAQLAEQARGGTAPTAEQSPRVRDASDITRLAAEAEQYLSAASSGMAQAAATGIGEAFGISSDASKADAQLRTIAGQLVSKMPRMEGPQSNIDVQLYREMAGDIANPRLPAETRKAALKTIIDLNAKYAAPGSQAEAQASQPTTGDGMAAPRSKAEFDALPSGATFRAPDGTIRRKP